MDRITELEAELAIAKKRAREEGDAAWKELTDRAKGQLDWSVRWEDKYTLYVSARYHQKFLDEMEAMDTLYMSSYSRIHDDHRRWRGMTYNLVGNVLIQSGGGWCVLHIPRNGTFRAWRELTDEQVDALRAGIVPDDLKTDWAKP